MKRFLLIIACLAWATTAQAQATLKPVVGVCHIINNVSCTITPGVAITSGDALVVVVGATTSSATLTSVTATGHTFTVLDNIGGASQPAAMDAYECNAASGSPTFTVTTSNLGGGNGTARMYEVQGNATGACVDGHGGQTQTSPGTGPNGITSGTAISVTTNGEAFIGATFPACCTVPTYTAGTNVAWTNLQQDATNGLASEELAQATAASLKAEFTQSANQRAATLIIGILPSGGGGGGSTGTGNKAKKLCALGVTCGG